MKIINTCLCRQEVLFTPDLQDGMIHRVSIQVAMQSTDAGDIDARSRLMIPPLVKSHIHPDTILTAGEPEQSRSGTLFEGITHWSQRKVSIIPEGTRQRTPKAIDMLRDFGVQYARAHVDVIGPPLAVLEALLAVRQEATDLIDLQVVVFPQEGIESYSDNHGLMTHATEMGADVMGGIPYYENVRGRGASPVVFLMDLIQRYGRLMDIHCDEISNPQSRFLEVLTREARVRGMGAQVTASHICAMDSCDNAYCSKLFRLLKAPGISFISCPTENTHLQGRFDSWSKRRDVTRVAELDRTGINVCLAQDSIRDPWHPLGSGNILRILDAGLHICHMLDYDDLQRCLDFVTDDSARALCLGDNYGFAEGRPANLLILDMEDGYEAVRRQTRVLTSIRHGKAILQRKVEHTRYPV